jgi:membrane fusion protein, copper/silver efflux system
MTPQDMNRYIVRTSIFWLVLFAVVATVYLYRDRFVKQTDAAVAGIQPIASGPSAENTSKDAPISGTKMEVPLAPLQLSDEQKSSIGVETETVEYKQLSDEIRATGTVDVDERLQSSVQVRFSGYIRKVFANATYQYVHKGDPLFTIYSPDLVATQEEYLIARRNQSALGGSSIDGVASGASSLTTAAEQRLRQWDIPESEIAKLKESGKSITELTINSPASGYITDRVALPNMYVEPATKLYALADLSRVWVSAQVFQNDVGRLKRGDIALITVDAYPGRSFRGGVEEILPQVDMTTRTVKVRLAVNNPGVTLKPGMFVTVDLKSALGRQLVVPASAVFQTGTRQVVFVDHGNGSLLPKDVSLGGRVGDDFVVLRGLEVHQKIVTSANFLLDSESQLQAAPDAGQQASTSATAQQSSIATDFTTDPSPVRKGSNALRVRLTDAKGQPVAGAQVTATFFFAAMPAMGMGAVNTSFQLTQKSPGVYDGTGTLEYGGTWQVTVTVKQDGQIVGTKQLRVNAEGGM